MQSYDGERLTIFIWMLTSDLKNKVDGLDIYKKGMQRARLWLLCDKELDDVFDIDLDISQRIHQTERHAGCLLCWSYEKLSL